MANESSQNIGNNNAPLASLGSSDFSSLTGGGQGAGPAPGAPATRSSPPTPTPQMGKVIRRSVQESEAAQGRSTEGEGQQAGDGTETGQSTEGQTQENQTQEGQQQTGQQQEGQTGETQQTPQITQQDIIRQAIEQGITAGVQATRQDNNRPVTQPQGEPELTPEQFREKYKVVSVTPDHMNAILRQPPEQAAATFNSIIQGAVQQAVLMSMDITAARVGKIQKEFEPHISSWQSYQREQREAKATEAFYKKYPDLANEKDIVRDVKDAYVARVRAGQVSFKNEEEAFAALAQAARNIVKRFNPNGGTGNNAPGQGQQQTGQGTTRRMSAASTAGRAGNSGPAAKKSDAELVFGAEAR